MSVGIKVKYTKSINNDQVKIYDLKKWLRSAEKAL